MTKVRVLKNNDNLAFDGKRVKEIVLSNFNTNISDVSEITTIFMNNLGKEHRSSKSVIHVLIGNAPGDITEHKLTNKVGSYELADAVKLEFDVNDYVKEVEDGLYYISEKHNEIYVPYDLTGVAEEDLYAFLEHLTAYIRINYIDELTNRDSWVRSKKRDVLKDRVKVYLSKDIKERLRSKKNDLEDVQRRINDYRRALAESLGRIRPMMLEIEALENGEVSGVEQLIEGLDLIAGHPRVADLVVKENLIEVLVNDIVARVRIDQKDRFFYMGNMTFKIDIKNLLVTFDGTEKHKSYWSSKDPHPHVSQSGSPCLGNVETTIHQLCEQYEIYPVFLMCLDYVQSVNIEDAAGKNVFNWKEVNEDGSELVKEESEVEEFPIPVPVASARPTVRVLLTADGDYDEMTEEEAKEIATYVAYASYIGYVHNNDLEEIEEYLSEGGEV